MALNTKGYKDMGQGNIYHPKHGAANLSDNEYKEFKAKAKSKALKAKSMREMSAEDRTKMRSAQRFHTGGQVPSAYPKSK